MATIDLGRVGFVNKGAYSGIFAYKLNDVVVYNSGTYACIQANTGQLPTATAYWQVWVSNDKAPLDSPALVNPTINGVAQSGYTGFKNLLINGGFDVWQRGNGSFGSGTYCADRWLVTGSAPNVDRDVSIERLVLSSASSTYCGIQQRIEGGQNLSGKEVTISFLKSTSIATSSGYITIRPKKISDGTSLGTSISMTFDNSIGSGSVALTATMPTFTHSPFDIMIEVIISLTSATAEACNTSFSNIQLEEGSVATPFEQRPYGLELSLCQRYYEKSFFGTAPDSTSVIGSFCASVYRLQQKGVQFKVTKRTNTPSVTIFSPSTGASGKVRNESSGSDINAAAIRIGAYGFELDLSSGSGTVGNEIVYHYTVSNEL